MSQSIAIARGPLADVPEAIAAELRAASFFAGLTVMVADPMELAFEIDQVVSTAKGLAILVESPSGNNTKPGVFGTLRFDDVTINVNVTESVGANRCATGTGLPAQRVLCEVMRHLHGYRPAGADQMLSCRSFARLEDESLLVYRATFGTALALGSNADLRERRSV